MCGITGILDPDTTLKDLPSVIEEMTDRLHLRGPDDRGTIISESGDLALGHRRLSIIDPNPRGRQPMVSESGRFLLVYNGEIYNFKALRNELEKTGSRFKTKTDTEVLLEGCDRWGLLQTVERLHGMFAFALFDRTERALHLVRDRVGIKPLLYWSDGRSSVFGSELSALESCPLVPCVIDPLAVRSLLRHSCITGTRSMIKGVRKVMPGSILTLQCVEGGLKESEISYWDPVEVSTREHGRYHDLSFEEQSSMLETMLSDSISDRLISDVPLGCFLSGGIDSSLVVGLAQKASSSPLKTFTIGMTKGHLDESEHARRIASHLGTDHSEHVIDENEVLSMIPEMSGVYDEPFADSSQIPTFLVSRIARRSVTVALSGDGGDELFGGYARYTTGLDSWKRMRRLPNPVHGLFDSALKIVPDPLLDAAAGFFGPQEFSHRCRRLARIMRCTDVDSMHDILASTWDEGILLGGPHQDLGASPRMADSRFSDPERMMLRDFREYLVDDILTKLDRASMSASLEARVPLLDHRVVEMAWGLPLTSKIDGRRGKRVLRDILSRHMPESMFERPKMGFSVPLADWLRGPLREWVEDSLFNGSLDELSLDGERVRSVWDRFLAGDAFMLNGVWSMSMLSGWLSDRQWSSH